MSKPSIQQDLEAAFKIQLSQADSFENCYLFRGKNKFWMDKNGNLGALNLSKNGLKSFDFPKVIDFSNLRGLSLGENEITALEIPFLPKLEYLILYENKTLQKITFHAALPALKVFEAFECDLQSIEFPAGLSRLEKVDLRKNKLTKCHFADSCPELSFLDLSENQLKALQVPAGFSELRFLYLNDNALENLAFKGVLPSLEVLHLRNNKLEHLPNSFLQPMPKLGALYLYGNPLPTTLRGTIENSKQKSCLQFLKDHFAELAAGSCEDNEHKVLLIGNGNVGKSCLVERLVHDTFEGNWNSTHAIALEQHDFDGQKLNLWDFAGQDVYHATHRLFMQANAVYLVLWDEITEGAPSTARTENGHLRHYENFDRSYWLDYALFQGENSPTIVVQTKIGDKKPKDCPDERANYGDQFKFLEFHGVESEEDDWTKNGYRKLLARIKEALESFQNKDQLPVTWAALRQILRDKQSGPSAEKFIELRDYLILAQAVPKPIDVLENWLVKSGVVFYRKGFFQDRIILDQAWAIRAVYAIFNRETYHFEAFQKNNGQFSGHDLKKIWVDYSPNERELFLGFMIACELCFETTPKKERHESSPFAERTFIAPQFLSEERPESVEELREQWAENPAAKRIYVRYSHKFLHQGIIQRFIVRTHAYSETKNIWKNGIRLKENGKHAIIEASKKEINVQISENGFELLDKVRNLLDLLQDRKGEESVSADGQRFVLLEKLKSVWSSSKNSQVEATNGDGWVDVVDLAHFLQKDETKRFESADEQKSKNLTNLNMSEINKLIAAGEIEDALNLIEGFLPQNRKDEVILQKSRFASWKKDKREGTVSAQDLYLRLNQITSAVIELAGTVEIKRAEPETHHKDLHHVEPSLRTYKIFIASSAELLEDRREFEIFINRENKHLVKKGIFLELVQWEDFLDAVSQTRLQDEYNQALRECDIVVSLFFTKVGKYTAEEFDTALGQFRATGKPKIFTYFKNAPINTGNITDEIMTLLHFKNKLKELGHFCTAYENHGDLKHHFGEQLKKLGIL